MNLNKKLLHKIENVLTFDELWDLPIELIDKPNKGRGGWSCVGRIDVLKENKPVSLFVKKQLNHNKRTLFHPFQGVPTFLREFKTINHLKKHDFKVPNIVFFGHRKVNEGQQAILVTEMLSGYKSLDRIEITNLSLLKKRDLLFSLAKTISKLHTIGIQHRALYPKHIFVKPIGEAYDVVLIDLEKSRRMLLPCVQGMADLVTLIYRSRAWTKSARHFFYLQYVGRKKLSLWNRLMYCNIKAKIAKKRYSYSTKEICK